MSKCVALRAWVLGAAVLASAGFALGDTAAIDLGAKVNSVSPNQLVTVHYSGSLGNVNTGAYAGAIKWTVASGAISGLTSPLAGETPLALTQTGGTFSTYCIDLTQDINIGGTFPFHGLTDELANTPVTGDSSYLGMGAASGNIINLYGNEYNAVTADDAIPYDISGDTDQNAGDEAAAFQIAIWDIIYGKSGLSVANSSNPFYITTYGGMSSAEFNEITGMADLFVSGSSSTSTPLDAALLALTDSVTQDQLVIGQPGTKNSPPTVPTPSEAISGVVLLGGLSLVKRLRRVR